VTGWDPGDHAGDRARSQHGLRVADVRPGIPHKPMPKPGVGTFLSRRSARHGAAAAAAGGPPAAATREANMIVASKSDFDIYVA